METNENWVTLLHLRKFGQNRLPHLFQDVDFCCPLKVFCDLIQLLLKPFSSIFQEGQEIEIAKNTLQRHPCNITEAFFVQHFVRKKIPVILTDCEGYGWIQKYDLTVENVAKVKGDSLKID